MSSRFVWEDGDIEFIKPPPKLVEVGTAASGDRGHPGRPGQRGGSEPGPGGAGKNGKTEKPTSQIGAIRASMPKSWFDATVRKKNLLKIYDEATDRERKYGEAWYTRVHADTQTLATDQNVTLRQAAGVIAVMSPRLDWKYNMEAAYEFFKHPDGYDVKIENGRLAGQTVKGIELSNGMVIMQSSLAQARDVLANPDAQWFEFHGNRGPSKTYNFFQNIYDPTNPNYVTIDRHTMSASVGKALGAEEIKGLNDNVREYNTFKEPVERAAYERSVPPAVFQAVTWTHWKTTYAGRKATIKQLEDAFN